MRKFYQRKEKAIKSQSDCRRSGVTTRQQAEPAFKPSHIFISVRVTKSLTVLPTGLICDQCYVSVRLESGNGLISGQQPGTTFSKTSRLM
eukprot:6192493-Pleurochrysis_carterae.AAC.2